MLACFIALIHHQTLATLTYSNFGARTEVVIAELAKLTGQNLSVSADIRDVPLTVRVKDAPVQAVLDHIASSEGARWRTNSQGTVLVFDPATFDRLEAQRQARLIKDRVMGIEQWIKDTREREAKPKEKNDSGWPQGVVIARIVESLGPDNIASFDPRFQTVFGYPVSPLMHAIPELTPEELMTLTHSWRDDDNERHTTAEERNSRKVRLYFHVIENEAQVIFNPKAGNGYDLGKPNSIRFSPSYQPKKSDDADETQTPTFELSPILTAVTNQIRGEDEPVAENVKKFLEDPIGHEPASLMGEYYVHFADLKDVQLVAVPDANERESLGRWDRISIEFHLNADNVEDFLHRDGAEFTKNWITLGRRTDLKTGQPQLPTQRTLQKLLKTIDLTGVPTFEQLQLAFRQGVENVYTQPHLRILAPHLWTEYTSNRDFLKFIDCLDAIDLEALQRGQSVAVPSLPAPARAFLVDDLFGSGGGYLELDEDLLKRQGIDPDSEEFAKYGNYTDPWEVCKTAIPSNATVVMTHSSHTALKMDPVPGQYLEGLIFDVNQYASSQQSGSEPAAMIGTADTYILKVRFTPFSNLQIQGEFYRFPDKKHLKPSQWPSELRSAYAKAKAELDQERKQQESEGNDPTVIKP